MTTQVVEYSVTDAAIEEMKAQFMQLEVTDFADKKQIKAVHDARMIVRSKRIEVEKKRKELKADALKWGQLVDAEARRIKGALEPIEKHLLAEEEKPAKERERIQAEKDRKEQELVQERVDAFMELNDARSFDEVRAMSDADFEIRIAASKATFNAEQKRLKKEKQEQEAEAARIAADRAEIERVQKEQAEKAAALEAERKEIEAAKRAEQERKDREAFELKAKKDAAIQAEKDIKEKAERDKALEAEKEAMRTDKEKLVAFAEQLRELRFPSVDSVTAKSVAAETREGLDHLAVNIETIAEGM